MSALHDDGADSEVASSKSTARARGGVAVRAVAHAKGLWPRRVWLPFVPFVYCTTMSLLGFFRWEYIIVAGSCLVLAFATTRTRDFLLDVSPYVLFAITYDFVKYVIDATITPSRVITCGLRNLELALFQVSPGVTPQDYFRVHPNVVVDVICALPYAVFFAVVFIYAGYLFRVDRPRMRLFLWSFAIANLIAFTCWVLIPAAPPWYVHEHGCVADLATKPSPAGLLRVDQLTGIPYFQGFYARASQVFGAVPSMHCACPMLGLLTAYKVVRWRTRTIHILYVVTMFFASVYLDHHWIVDGLLGWILALVSVFIAQRMFAYLGWETSAATSPRSAESKESILAV